MNKTRPVTKAVTLRCHEQRCKARLTFTTRHAVCPDCGETVQTPDVQSHQ